MNCRTGVCSSPTHCAFVGHCADAQAGKNADEQDVPLGIASSRLAVGAIDPLRNPVSSAPQPANTAQALLRDVREWNRRYPSGRIFSHGEILKIAKEMDEINERIDAYLSAPSPVAQEPVAWADRVAFESAMRAGKGCDVWPKRGDSKRDLMPLYAAPVLSPVTQEQTLCLYGKELGLPEHACRSGCDYDPEEIKARIKAPVPAKEGWQPIETAPKGQLIDIWFVNRNSYGERWTACYYDNICGEWRTSRPSGHLVSINERYVTHWMPLPAAPVRGEE